MSGPQYGTQLRRMRKVLDEATDSDGHADLRHEPLPTVIVDWLVKRLEERQTVSHLWLNHCSLGDTGFERLLCGLGKTGVQHVSAPDNDITHQSIQRVTAALSSTSEVTQLQYLSLRGNKLTPACAGSLRQLAQQLHLKELSLEDMRVGDSTAKGLFDYCEQADCSLETLSLHNCSLTDDALAYLQQALPYLRSLEELTLASNGFSTQAGGRLLNAVTTLPQQHPLQLITLPNGLRPDLQHKAPRHVHIEWV